jgi:chaperonin cofactor prefoldin
LDPVTPPTDGTEIIDVKVREVSLVDRPAIRRRFSAVKSEDGANDPTEGDPVKRTTNQPAKKTEETEVSKATGDLVTALAADYVSVAIDKLVALKSAATSGTLKRADLWTAMDGVYAVLYKLNDQLCVVAKSMGDDVAKELEVAKADRKMTRRRLGELKGAIDSLSKLCGELEATMEEDDTTTAETKAKSETLPTTSAAGTVDTTAIAKAVGETLAPVIASTVTKAVEPVETRLKAVEDRIGVLEKAQEAKPAATETPVAKAEAKPADDLASTIAQAVTKAVEPLAKRVSAIEATPATTPTDKTETTTKKADADFWSGVV